MKTLGTTALLLISLPSWGAGQEAWTTPPAWVVTSIRSQVAKAWDIEPADVVLEWHTTPHVRPALTEPSAGAEPELAGAGKKGEWIARLPAVEGLFSVRLRAGQRRILPVAARSIERGTRLEVTDIRFVESVRWGPPPPDSPPSVLGWQAQRRLAGGEELTTPAVRPAATVRAGERVKVIWRAGRVALTISAVAVNTARPGERVAVRLDGGRRLRGIAGTDGVVRIEGV